MHAFPGGCSFYYPSMDYEIPLSKLSDDVQLKNNTCYSIVERQPSDLPPKLPPTLSSKRNGRGDTVQVALLVVSVVIAILLIVVVALVASFTASSIPRQLNALQEEIALLRSSLSVSNSLTSGNTSTKLLDEINMKVDNLSSTLGTIKINNATSQDISPANFMPGSYIFESCAMVALSFPSGLYWIRSSNGTIARQVYCSSPLSGNSKTAGWRRVGFLDTSQNESVQCPSGLEARTDPNSCRRKPAEEGCTSVFYSTQGISYSCILGRINARQSGHPDAFNNFQEATGVRNSSTIDNNYVDGVILTYGSNPRKHIWTLGAGLYFFDPVDCNRCNDQKPTHIVGSHYFCELNMPCNNGTTVCNDPLWDGNQCVGDGTFYRQLPQPTTEDIEMRVCRDQDRSDEDILITFVELYVI